MERLIISICTSVLGAILFTLCSLKAANILQLSSYKSRGVLAWLRRTKYEMLVRCFALGFFTFIIMLMFCVCFPNSPVRYTGYAFFTLLSIYFIYLQAKIKQKTPLKFTPRIIRLLIITAILNLCLVFIGCYFTFNTAIGYSPIGIVAMLIPFTLLFSSIIIRPLECLINRGYYIKAQKILANSSIIKIGITGSYGKTTTKNILSTLLSAKYKVLKSPLSYNTPMGIARVVNGGLENSDIFIAEMGAKNLGDISELCRLVSPDYGIITSIGNQHLETFLTIENVLNTKFELANACKTCIVNSDDQRIMTKCAQIGNAERFLYSGSFGANASFSNVNISSEGTSFDLTIDGQTTQICTKLLGRHIPSLFCLCALLAHKLGIKLEEIAQAATQIEAVEHRLQLIKTENFIIIDDAYNSNPEGAKNALEILTAFNGERCVITPGFIELGKSEKQLNFELGERIALSADYLFAVKNPDIENGAKSKNMQNIFAINSLDEAIQKLKTLALSNAIVLFLNDLPDNY